METALEKTKIALKSQIETYLLNDILKFKVTLPEKFEINNPDDLEIANMNIKISKGELKRIQAETKPIKVYLDECKDIVLALEKDIDKQSEKVVKFFEASIQDYKKRELEKQKRINELFNDIASARQTTIVQFQNLDTLAYSTFAKMQALVQEWEISKADIPIEESADAVEILDALQEEIKSEPILAEPIYERRNFVPTKAIATKESYSISDEQAFKEYCLEKKLYTLLSIKPALAVFNVWVKEGNNKKLPFVQIDQKLK